MLHSEIKDLSDASLPAFSGVRVMMMPFLMQDPETVPEFLSAYRPLIAKICALATAKEGVGYLTIDEALVLKGETHRRPGLHVDGAGPYGGGGGYAANGMFLVASHEGCMGYRQTLAGKAGLDGNCEHLRLALAPGFVMRAGRIYWCSPEALHESLPMRVDTHRQLLRVSMPSNAPYHREYTPNPTGIVPPGEPAPARPQQMAFRP